MVKTILAIEDDPQIGVLLEMLLESPELRVLHYMTGSEGWQGIQEHRPNLIILDVKIPEMTGWEVFDAVRADPHLAETPIIMLSVSQAEFERKALFQQSHVNFYMTKPFEILTLRRKIKEVLAVEKWQMADTPIKPRPQTSILHPIDKNLLTNAQERSQPSRSEGGADAADDARPG
ncbi:MAG: response regulator [Anaerolineae bacterium]|nr:response regulator [Anaerolineae bacterium]